MTSRPWPGPGRRTVLALAATSLLLSACGGGADDGGLASPTAPSTSGPMSEAGSGDTGTSVVARLDGLLTASDYTAFGDDDPDRWEADLPEAEDVRFPSTADGSEQPAKYLPPAESGAPLLVVLHSWSTPYRQHLSIPFGQWARTNGWAMAAPDFRGVNERPESTGSELAVQDVIDVVDLAVERDDVDPDRVFVVGFSGGGMMSLLMAGRHPERFAGAVAWVPIHDLTDWYAYNRDERPDAVYAGQIEAACGGDPTADPAAGQECDRRSPTTHLDAARDAGVPVYLGVGLDDEVVPPGDALRSFIQLAGDDALPTGLVEAADQGELPDDLRGSVEGDTFFTDDDPDVLFAREQGQVTLVVFDGDHDMVYGPGTAWLAELAAN